MRIRTDGEYAHRQDTIEQAAEEFDCNKTRAVLLSCEVAADVLPALQEALDEADIRPSAKQEIADAVSSHQVSIDVERESVTIDLE
jgi:hypothetical protein